MKFTVTVTETLEQTVTVEADSPAEAEEEAERRWKRGDYILGADDFSGVVIRII